ncbi:MAG: beta-Ala-His dipeptidase [Halobacteriovoraceae bacterium]|nr:beta-Ala-His dipeptidase [Halobacteriovoraceae bacterium]MCB9095467.1 beta-Ala-His dipeptidase [Halobacteriovoraceae bacterium]
MTHLEINEAGAPKNLWNLFGEMTKVPRPSKSEDKIRSYFISIAEKNSFDYQTDEAGNLVIHIPASKGKEKTPKLIIQNHLDMVTDAVPGKSINFLTDPIEAYVDGSWVKARGTTLGADNGIGCAAAMALALDEKVSHPAMDLLFTIDEETGLTGALELNSQLASGDFVLNLDTEEWGSLYVGCAGGANFEFNKNLNFSEVPNNYKAYKVSLNHFAGGHSGVDIHRYRANSCKMLIKLLTEFKNQEIRIAEFNGGKAHNIIPRDAYCIFYADPHYENDIQNIAEKITDGWRGYLAKEDQNFEIKLEVIDHNNKALNSADSQEFVALMNFFPDGVYSIVRGFTQDGEALVATSNNVAKVILINEKLYILTSMRFFNRDEATSLENQFHLVAEQFNLKLDKNSEYPSWNPNFESSLLAKAKNVYAQLFGEEPKVKAIHAGLECGILMDRLKGNVEAISFGPTITNAHSPDEGVHIPSVSLFWKYLVSFVESF